MSENLHKYFWNQLKNNIKQQLGSKSPFGLVGKILMLPFALVTVVIHLLLVVIFYKRVER